MIVRDNVVLRLAIEDRLRALDPAAPLSAILPLAEEIAARAKPNESPSRIVRRWGRRTLARARGRCPSTRPGHTAPAPLNRGREHRARRAAARAGAPPVEPDPEPPRREGVRS